MRSLLIGIIVVLAMQVAAVSAVAQEDEAAGVSVFAFNPEAPLEYVEEVKHHRVTVAIGAEPPSEAVVSRVRYNLTAVEDGYEIRTTPLSFTLEKDGKPHEDKITEAIQMAPLVYKVASDGKLRGIGGHAAVTEFVRANAPKEFREQMLEAASEKTLAAKESSAWQSRVGDFLGKSTARGTGVLSESQSSLPDGSTARYFTVSVVMGSQELDGRELVKVKYAFTADPARVQRLANDLARDVVQGLPRPRAISALAGFSINGGGERLIDPKSMVVYSDSMERNIQMIVSAGGGSSFPVVMHETRTTRVLGSAAKADEPGAGEASPDSAQ